MLHSCRHLTRYHQSEIMRTKCILEENMTRSLKEEPCGLTYASRWDAKRRYDCVDQTLLLENRDDSIPTNWIYGHELNASSWLYRNVQESSPLRTAIRMKGDGAHRPGQRVFGRRRSSQPQLLLLIDARASAGRLSIISQLQPPSSKIRPNRVVSLSLSRI